MNHNNFSRIQLYLNHKMTGQEKEQFELDLFTDVELRKNYDQEVEQLQEARYLVDETLSEREEQLFEDSWREATAQIAQELKDDEAPQKSANKKTWVLTGVLVLAILAMGLHIALKFTKEAPTTTPPDTISAQVPLPIAKNQSLKISELQDFYSRNHELNGGASEKKMMLGLLNSLEQGSYPKALLQADTFLTKHDSTSRNVLFFKAYSLLQLEQPSEAQLRTALYIFEEKLYKVPSDQMLNAWEITYFKALCYTMLKNEMAASAILRQLLQTDCNSMGLLAENCTLYKKEALDLYNSLKQ